MTILLGTPRRLAHCWPVIAQRGILLRNTGINPAQVDLAGTVTASLSAQRTAHHDIVTREGLDAGRDRAGTPFAGHDKGHAAAGKRLRGVPGTHPRIVREEKAKVSTLLQVVEKRAA